MKNLLALLCVSAFLLSSPFTTAQVVTDGEGDVMIGGIVIDPSAIFELISTTKGFLLPRMTEVQRDNVVSPASALMIFNTDSSEFQYWDADTDQWEIFLTSVNLSDFGWLITGNAGLAAWDGSSGNFLGTRDNANLVLMTQQAQAIDFWTNNVQRAFFSSDGNFLPAEGDRYSLGTDVNRWSELFVTGGSVHIGDTVGTREMILGYQEVNGTTTGTIGVNGTPSMNITTTEVNFTGNTDVDGTLTVDDITTLTGNVDAMNGLDVTGADLTVGDTNFTVDNAGNTGIAGTLVVDDSVLVVDDSVTFRGNVDAMNGLDVTGADLTVGGTNFTVDDATGNTGIAGTLVVDDSVTFRGNVDAMDGLDVTGADLTVGGTNFTVDNAGNTGIAGTLVVDDSVLVVDDSVTFRGNVDAMNGLDVTGADLTVGGTNFTVDNAGNTGIAGTLVVDDSVLVVDDSVTFRGNVDAMNGLDVTGNTSITDSLTVDGPTILGNGQIDDKVIVNTRTGSVDLTIREDGLSRTSSTDQWFAIDNLGTGHVGLLINGASSTTNSNSRLTVNDGHWTSQQGTAPTISGVGGVTGTLLNATDVAGMVEFTTTNATAGRLVQVQFNVSYITAPIVVLTAANDSAASHIADLYVESGTDNFTVNFVSNSTAGATYKYYYQVIETQQ